MQEMKDSGAGKLVTELRKHPTSKSIADATRLVREKWMQAAGVSNKTEPPSASAPVADNVSAPIEQLAVITAPERVDCVIEVADHQQSVDPPLGNLLRCNAVRLLDGSLGCHQSAVRFEQEIFDSFGERKDRYLECITRFASSLQVCISSFAGN